MQQKYAPALETLSTARIARFRRRPPSPLAPEACNGYGKAGRTVIE
jgi:hypothetical protein